jgi:hypothetical protein
MITRIAEINDSPAQVFIAATGGGSKWVGEFLNIPGGSNTLIGFYVPYASSMTDDFLGGPPRESYVSDSTARQLAVASFEKAKKAVELPLAVGIGVTCSLKKENEREGRKNCGFLAIQTISETKTVYFEFISDPNLTAGVARSLQDKLVTKIIHSAVIHSVLKTPYSEFFDSLPDSMGESIYVTYSFSSFTKEQLELEKEREIVDLFSATEPHMVIGEDSYHTSYVFPGSFNPLHDHHVRIADAVKKFTGSYPIFELCISNFDKPNLDIKEIIIRYRALRAAGYNVIVTNTPKLIDKSRLYGYDTTFVVGEDTFDRFDVENEGEEFYHRRSKLLVFPRGDKSKFDRKIGDITRHPFVDSLTHSVGDIRGPEASRDLRKLRA